MCEKFLKIGKEAVISSACCVAENYFD